MSEAILLQPVNKPGTSCLGCRRRKLKCSRESDGCNNCTKSDLPCVYPAPEVGVKKKRGPYKKDKPARQRHLEDLVKYLEPKSSSPDSSNHTDAGASAATNPSGNAFGSTSAFNHPSPGQGPIHNANSEDLVKDALIALTKSSVSDQDSRLDNGAFLSHNSTQGAQPASGSHHPPIRRIFEYWSLYQARVDPLVKVFHCPTIGKALLNVIDDLDKIPPSFEALLFSIYYAAVSSCTAREVRQRFGERQDVLMQRYGRCIEASLADNYEIPPLETLQALVLYIICIRRQDDGTSLRALFTLAVRSAQIMRVHEDGEGRYPPFEVEYRRRLWYHLCGLENRTAEEGESRLTSIMQNHGVQLPSNLNDCDLSPRMKESPRSRSGVTEMAFVLMRFELQRLMFGIWTIRRQQSSSWARAPPGGAVGVREEQMSFMQQATKRLESDYRAHMDSSRPFDWLCLHVLDGMLIKAQLQIDFPFGTIPNRAMPANERSALLKASVDVIQFTHVLAIDDRVSDWQWYFRGYVQWHSIAIVVSELSWNTNTQFVDFAWQVMDPVLADWDAIYKTKRGEPAWDHVNNFIERARYLRRQRKTQREKSKQTRASSPTDTRNQRDGSPINARANMPSRSNTSEHQAYPGNTSQQAHTPQSTSIPTSGNDSDISYNGQGSIVNFHPGYSPSSDGLLENIDFSAFDQVFGNGTWDFMDPLEDVNVQLERIDRCQQAMDTGQ